MCKTKGSKVVVPLSDDDHSFFKLYYKKCKIGLDRHVIYVERSLDTHPMMSMRGIN